MVFAVGTGGAAEPIDPRNATTNPHGLALPGAQAATPGTAVAPVAESLPVAVTDPLKDVVTIGTGTAVEPATPHVGDVATFSTSPSSAAATPAAPIEVTVTDAPPPAVDHAQAFLDDHPALTREGGKILDAKGGGITGIHVPADDLGTIANHAAYAPGGAVGPMRDFAVRLQDAHAEVGGAMVEFLAGVDRDNPITLLTELARKAKAKGATIEQKRLGLGAMRALKEIEQNGVLSEDTLAGLRALALPGGAKPLVELTPGAVAIQAEKLATGTGTEVALSERALRRPVVISEATAGLWGEFRLQIGRLTEAIVMQGAKHI